MADHSQFGEQSVILEHCGKQGRFCDVGAYDAFTFSNTRALVERGWGGVAIEPNPEHAARLRTQYPAGGDVVVVEAALGLFPGVADMRMTSDATSTAHAATYAKWRDQVDYQEGIVQVPVVTWGEVWQRQGPFHVVSIDAEGWSMPLLGRLLDLGHRPRVIVVEHDGQLVNAAMLGSAAGYRVALRNDTNLVMAFAGG